jgi:PAS domain S-box-containing protein
MGFILIAFERESEQNSVEQMLSGRGHRVLKCGNGLAALDAARREQPDAVVSDIVLPRMDGFALCRKWKQDENLQAVPFIFYTRRHGDPKYERFALELGAERFIARTLQPEALLAALDELLPAAPAQSSPTTPLPALDEAAVKRIEAVEKAQQQQQAQALEQTQRAQQQAEQLQQQLQQAQQNAQQAQQQVQHLQQQSQQAQQQLRSQIAEMEAASQLLQRQIATNRALLDAAADGYWALDADGRLTDVNAAYCRMSGYQRDALLSMKAADIEDGSSGETTMRLQLGRLNGGGRYETKHRRADGSLLDVEVSVGLLDTAGSIVLIRDNTQRRREMVSQRLSQRQLEFLVDLYRQAQIAEEPALITRVLEQAADVTSSALAYLYLIDTQSEEVTLAGWGGRGQIKVTHGSVEPRPIANVGMVAECARTKQPVWSNDQNPNPLLDGLPPLQRYCAVPLVIEDQTVAVLGVANRDDGGYVDLDQRILLTLVDSIWRVLHAKRAHTRTMMSLQRTDVALQSMIDSLVRVSEHHDPYTAGSARRLAALAVALGREAGLDGERQHSLRVAALLHDIGNVAVPAAILAKPTLLTAGELALMRTHAEEGGQLLADIDFGAPVADIVYQHHERHDGSGYPRGLKGDEIMVEARILGIADTIEAMCSPRPYRAAFGLEAALAAIERAAGTLYDPHLVAACIRLFRQHGFKME